MSYFQPNCTLPPDGVNYVASPNVRTTLDILWSSLATIIACTYSVLHLNIPEQRRGRDPGWKGDMKWAFRRFGTKLKWCIMTIFLPELIFTKAVSDWWNARKQLKLLHRECPDTCQTVTITHMLFAGMGGFVLAYRTGDLALSREDMCNSSNRQGCSQDAMSLLEPSKGDEEPGSRSCHADVEVSQRSELSPHAGPSEDAKRPKRQIDYWHLETQTLVKLIVKEHLPFDLPPVEEITDRSKSDLLTKVITLLQICYFVLAVLVRVGHGQAICELELGTVAFVTCSALTYAATFAKPKSPETPIVLLDLAPVDTMRRVREYAKYSSAEQLFSSTQGYDYGGPPRNDLSSGGAGDIFMYASFLIAALFSSIHIAGWNLNFPSVPDMWLWRTSALATTGAPLIVIGLIYLMDSYALDSLANRWWFDAPFWMSALMYSVGRLILIVEMFRGLAYLPPDAFTTTWTANIPHIG